MTEHTDYISLKNELADIKELLNAILCKLNDLEDIKKSSTKLDNHIDFIENTYDTLVLPLNFLKNTVSRITGSGNTKNDLICLNNNE
jgi:hypothetical protein